MLCYCYVDELTRLITDYSNCAISKLSLPGRINADIHLPRTEVTNNEPCNCDLQRNSHGCCKNEALVKMSCTQSITLCQDDDLVIDSDGVEEKRVENVGRRRSEEQISEVSL